MLRRTLIVALAVAATYTVAGPAGALDAAPPAELSGRAAALDRQDRRRRDIRYPAGDAHVTAAIVTLAPGGRTIMHKHGVPLFA